MFFYYNLFAIKFIGFLNKSHKLLQQQKSCVRSILKSMQSSLKKSEEHTPYSNRPKNLATSRMWFLNKRHKRLLQTASTKATSKI
jgi:hypothetical protein